MKKLLRILLYAIGSLLGLVILFLLGVFLYLKISSGNTLRKSKALEYAEVKTLNVDGFTFRDLNKNGKPDIYEDSRKPIEDRVNDLLSQMNLEEKSGAMFIPPVSMNKDGSISEKPSLSDIFSFMSAGTSEMLFDKKINHFNIFMGDRHKGNGQLV